jgi:uncharacterized protein YndB with AHSA1/START domain
MSTQTDVVVREVRIEAAPTVVFSYFVDPAKLVTWKAATAELDARPGGGFRMDVTGRGDVAHGEYLVIDPPRRIRFTWRWENTGPDAPPSVVEVTFTADGSGTLLRLVHRGIPAAVREGSAAGWDHYLARLAVAAPGHDPGPDPWADQPPDGGRADRPRR